MSRSSRLLVAALVVGGMFSVSGCSVAGTELPEFQRAQADADRITADSQGVDMVVDPDSTRFVGEVGTYGIYLARSDDGRSLCLVAVTLDDNVWKSTGCGGGNGVTIGMTDGTEIQAGPGAGVGDGSLSESVVVLND